jgi:CRISPR-associated protein Csb2
MRVVGAAESPSADGFILVTDEIAGEVRARSLSQGTLDMLQERYGEEPRLKRVALTKEINDLQLAKRKISGTGAKELKAQMDGRIEALKNELGSASSQPPVRPTTGIWTGYRCRSDELPTPIAHSLFDHDILVLTHILGPRLPVVTTLAVTQALRNKILRQCAQPVPGWVSGHEPDGQPFRDATGHLALVPLPFVDRAHADGHLLGVALVFPRYVSHKERGRALGRLLVNTRGEPENLGLEIDRLGAWTIQKSDGQETARTLDPCRWTAFPAGATTWTSATPVVLDRYPKANRSKPSERSEWEAEVREIIVGTCQRIGLPAPEHVDVDTTSWLLGSARAVGKRRPLRGHGNLATLGDAALGDGFPPFPPKGSNGSRPQVHAWLRFNEPVVGPIVLGAGRYLGYGLCKPLKGVRA